MDVTQIIIACISIVFLGVIVPLVKMLFAWLKSKTENEGLKAAYDEAERVADYVVAGVQADIVDGLKAKNVDGKLTKDEAKEVMVTAVNRLLDNLTTKTYETLEDNKDDIVDFLAALIEQRLAISKK